MVVLGDAYVLVDLLGNPDHLLVSLVMPRQRRSVQAHRETPLEVLQRRYAAGEISTEEYDEHKARLERDRAKPEM